MKAVESLRVTTIVENDIWQEGLASSWGLSVYAEALMENGKTHKVLMDTSGSFKVLFKNSSRIGIDLAEVDRIFISHWHGDHVGALSQLLPLIGHSVPVYIPSIDRFGVRKIEKENGRPIVCSEATELVEGLISTGEMSNGLSEHSLLVNVKGKGLIVLVGCSHPGIIKILKRARQVSHVNTVYGVIGGFHISEKKAGIEIGEFLKKLNVEIASPCHCTSQDARKGIAEVVREKYVSNGSGKTITIA